MKILVRSIALLSLLCCLSGAYAQTELKPEWEVGAGFAAIDFPMYRGSNERRSFLLPIPYFVYRGEKLQVNRERVRGLIFKRDTAEVDVSLNGSVPAKGSIARQGMPDLDPTLEVGPSLNIHLLYSGDKKNTLDLRMPLRGVIASDFKHVQGVGWLFQPQLDVDFRDIDHSGWNIGLVGGPIFSDRRYHQYFYDVAPQYATSTRPAYTASGGYSGMQYIFAFNRRQQDGHWVGGFMKWDNLNGAVFADSPLVKSKSYFTIGIAATWTFNRSDKLVEVNDD
ncbi:MipA/OmpV family protein [Sideroxydans lithotrophicus]|uniref:MltA-interacting MipA family protein n=1 Tax=Sideroxydans lithotrophicus (strain ES-1) TaxID=580332 RepID=D5CM01_SIDLE|nr:MipA/OmpV family protein [Sideroxydans lithotrophicus]ADE10615.1 MltA-interacting MipA family protein [Sideroxydans lithotrophicus ES-1]